MRRVLVLVMTLGATAHASDPCVLSGDGDLPAGVLSVNGVALGQTRKFERVHRVSLPVPVGDAAAPRTVRVSSDLVSISMTLVPSAPIGVVMKSPVKVSVFVATIGTAGVLLGADQGGPQLALEPPLELESPPLRGNVACKAVALTLRGATEVMKEPRGASVSMSQGEVPVAETADGAPVGTLKVGPSQFGKVLGRRGDRVHLWWSVTGGAVDGWVAASAVKFEDAHFGAGVGALGGRLGASVQIIEPDSVRCSGPVPLLARSPQWPHPLTVGTVAPRTALRRGERDTITVDVDGVLWDPGVELTIDWSKCRPSPRPSPRFAGRGRVGRGRW